MKTQVSIFALALASSAFAQVSEMSDGQPTVPTSTYVVTTAPPPETTPVETSGLSYGPYTITEADHTETVTLPIPSIPTSGWTSTVLTEPSYTETIPVPIGPTAPYPPPATPPAPYTETSPYIPPNPPVPSTGFTSVVISEGGATETVPVPQTPTAPAVTTPVETTPAPVTSVVPETTASVPYVAAAAFQTPMIGMLAGALGVMAAL